MNSNKDFRRLLLDCNSGVMVGASGPLVELYQDSIGVKVTGTWSKEDEAAYIEFSDKQNWALINEVLEDWAPSFWDFGIIDKEMILDLNL